MMPGVDAGSFLMGAAIVLLVVLAIDLIVAGGAMGVGMMSGVAGCWAHPGAGRSSSSSSCSSSRP